MIETKTWSFMDRSQWKKGPWEKEPDRKQWWDEKANLPCMAVRSPNFGHWGGYVGVGKDHPFFGLGHHACSLLKSCSEFEKTFSCEHQITSILKVHGGIVYSNEDRKSEFDRGICPTGENQKRYWFGFSCAHMGDISPEENGSMGVYRTLEYVEEECHRLAMQLRKIKEEYSPEVET